MNDTILYLIAALALAILVVQVAILMRSGNRNDTLEPQLRSLEAGTERLERELREELARGRQEAAQSARGSREEQAQALDRLAQALSGQVAEAT